MPETLDRRQLKKRRTRIAIQNTALEMFAAHGYHATTISAIADAADVAPRTVTWHFPAKEDLLFEDDPFAPDTLGIRIQSRAAGEPTLDAVRDWMAKTMKNLSSTAPEDPDSVWRQRALRLKVIIADDDLRARARSAYYKAEQMIAEGIGQDLGLPASALAPRLAAMTAIAGLRELHEMWEAQSPGAPPSTTELLALVDRVLDFARAGIAALQNEAQPSTSTPDTSS